MRTFLVISMRTFVVIFMHTFVVIPKLTFKIRLKPHQNHAQSQSKTYYKLYQNHEHIETLIPDLTFVITQSRSNENPKVMRMMMGTVAPMVPDELQCSPIDTKGGK